MKKFTIKYIHKKEKKNSLGERVWDYAVQPAFAKNHKWSVTYKGTVFQGNLLPSLGKAFIYWLTGKVK